jgi:phosphoserine phosphatase
VRTAIVSITWTFAVQRFAQRLGADAWVGTHVTETGAIEHFWPEDKPVWLRAHAAGLGIHRAEVAAVGDSQGDAAMLQDVGHAVFVGDELCADVVHAWHLPRANLLDVVDRLLSE